MPFKVLKVHGLGQREAQFGYRVSKLNGKEFLTIFLPSALAENAGLKEGDSVQFQVGDGKHAGCFALGKGKANSRVLSRWGKQGIKTRFPLLPLLAKNFTESFGRLAEIESDQRGIIVFRIED